MLLKQRINLNYASNYFKFQLSKKYVFLFILFINLNNVLCNNNDSKNKTRNLIILILLVVAFVIIITLIILFIVCICCKKRREDRNNYLEGSNVLEMGSQKELDLRERITNEGIQVLSNYLSDELIIDTYTKKFELFTNKCPICLENFIENKSTVIIGGCLHIFHKNCLCTLAEKIDLNKSIFSQFICPTCRNNLLDGIDKIKICLEIDSHFFDDIYKNKKITKMKHVKNLIEKFLEENKNKKIIQKEESSREKIIKNKKKENEIENENDYKDISFDDIVIPINKAKNRINDVNEVNKNDNIDNINNNEPV